MINQISNSDLFCTYYKQWVSIYKEGAIRKVTLSKYKMTISWIEKIIPNVKLADMDRLTYQSLLNEYALYHERQTTMDFHHQLKGAILDAVDEGLIERDPTRKAIIKGKTPKSKKPKYLNQFELHTLLDNLNLTSEINWDWFILLVAKTGMRFSEALALTPGDFDFTKQQLSIRIIKKTQAFCPLKTVHLLEKFNWIGKQSFNFLNWLKTYLQIDLYFCAIKKELITLL